MTVPQGLDAVDRLRPGDHALRSFTGAADLAAAVVPFPDEGCRREEQLLFIGPTRPAPLAAVSALPHRDALLVDGRPDLQETGDSDSTGAALVPRAQVEQHRRATRAALDGGRTGLRVAADVTELLRQGRSGRRWPTCPGGDRVVAARGGGPHPGRVRGDCVRPASGTAPGSRTRGPCSPPTPSSSSGSCPSSSRGSAGRSRCSSPPGNASGSLLPEHLGTDLGRLTVFAAAEAWWRGGHGTLQASDRDLRALRATTPTWRLAAGPTWLAREDGRVWSRFEAVTNRCYDAVPYCSLCLHDARRLPAEVLAAVNRSHPLTWGGAAPVPGPAYEDPAGFLRAVQPAWAPPSGARCRRHRDRTRAGPPRRQRRGALRPAGPARRRRPGHPRAAGQRVARRGVRRARDLDRRGHVGRRGLRRRPGLPDEALGYVPPDPERGPRGTWLAWSLADDAAVRSGPAPPSGCTPVPSRESCQRASKRVTRSGSATGNGLGHSEGVPVIGWASVTTTCGGPG